VLRVGLAQIDLTVGDIAGNRQRVLEVTAQAAAAGVQLVTFPEMTLTGYPPEDLVLRASFRAASRAHLVALARDLGTAGLGEVAVVVGYLDDSSQPSGPSQSGVEESVHSDDGVHRVAAIPRNAAAVCLGGRVVARYFKHHLPNYGVFDEARYFVPGNDFVVVRMHGVDVALTICEDVWQDGGPFAVARAAGVGLIVNINGSPYERDKDDVRLPLVSRRAAEADCPVVYVNTVGAQDELVFDGDSFVVDQSGAVLVRSPQFVEAVDVVDLDLPAATSQVTGEIAGMTVRRFSVSADPRAMGEPIGASVAPRISELDEVWRALVLGTADYIRKNGFRTVVLGISGGIDSAVVAAVAADAIGGENVYGVAMPSAYSSDHSLSDAVDLARRLGAHYQQVAIAPMVDAFVTSLALTGLAEENVQARVRGTTLMGLSNQHGHLVLATGNKSELAVGYSTIYGDAVGGFAPLKDVPKSLVWKLALWRNEQAAARAEILPIPPNSITKPPSAELRPDQLDSDSLPDYEVLDAVVAGYVDHDLGLAELIAAGHDREVVERVGRMIDAAEWKRRQYPPGPKISLKAFGRDRRLPISNRWREADQDLI
jgi:NAD+ synthase (glutamine-hydrolysing)